MKPLRTVTTLSALFVLVLPGPQAKAMGCQGIDAHGHCVDSKTVEWCDNGALQTAKCPENEICAKHPEYGEGYLCINKALTDCAGIPDEGVCDNENQALWCVEGELVTKECGADEVCGHDNEHGWVDCIPGGEVTPDPSEPPPGGDEPADPNGDAASFEETFDRSTDSQEGDVPAPMPNVTEGKPWKAEDPNGCGAGAQPSTPIVLVVVLLALFLSRKRRVV